jgi:hypothetical protein
MIKRAGFDEQSQRTTLCFGGVRSKNETGGEAVILAARQKTA